MQPAQAIQLPATVQVMPPARIDRLTHEDKHLLQVASVVGNDVPFTLLQPVAELPDAALRRRLDHLPAAEFVYETGGCSRIPSTHPAPYGQPFPAWE